jgi:hypothetical protein
MTSGGVLASVMLIIAQVPGDDPNAIVVWAENAPEDAVLSIHRVDETDAIGPAMFAKVELEGEKLKLTPSFQLSAGSKYRAVIKSKDGKILDSIDYETKAVRGPPPKVAKIYPRTKKLPANLLKFYLYFDQPMREGREIFDQIHIEDESGKRVHSPWRRLELWNEDATRLTLWIHPGRIKRGVNLREQLGPVLVPGKHYSLVIEKNVRDARGIPLGKEYRHDFSTLPEDHKRPLPQNWKIRTTIDSDSRKSLLVISPEPLDHALVTKSLKLFQNGKPVPISVDVGPKDTLFYLSPQVPTELSDCELRIGIQLEDLAGNTPERIFDTDLTLPDGEPAKLVIPIPAK